MPRRTQKKSESFSVGDLSGTISWTKFAGGGNITVSMQAYCDAGGARFSDEEALDVSDNSAVEAALAGKWPDDVDYKLYKVDCPGGELIITGSVVTNIRVRGKPVFIKKDFTLSDTA